jgi:hypothetical protein
MESESPPANDDTATHLSVASSTPAEAAPARAEPQRYRVQFEASEEYVDLVERAKALLSHAAPGAGLVELHRRAMRALVAELEREKYAATARPRSPAARKSEPEASGGLGPRQEPEHSAEGEPEPEPTPGRPRQRGRHVPAAIRRAVFERDAGRCTYRSSSGERCRETARLELHHIEAFARGGEHRLDNVTLHCRAHDALAAEQDFGSDLVAWARDSSPHESWAVHDAGPPTGSK